VRQTVVESLDLVYQVAKELSWRGLYGIAAKYVQYKEKKFSMEIFYHTSLTDGLKDAVNWLIMTKTRNLKL
jgi:hypothetical protein